MRAPAKPASEERASPSATLGAREVEVARREAALTSRAAELDTQGLLPGQMREANEQLVLTTLRAQALADAAGQARVAAEAVRDKLAATEMTLRLASGRKDEFLAMLGHELRNPLAPILTALELMKMRAPDASVYEREVIERQVRHLVQLIDDLLDVSRITSGKILLSRVPIELALVVARAIETASPLLESRRHTFTVAVPQTGLVVSADPGRLAQVIANLLTNAAKYTEPGGHVSVSACCESGWITLSVKDDGMGIPADLLLVVFDRFVQAQQTIERAQGGLGLGLAIVKSLIELHGGEVSAQSAGAGKGSEFTVRLPAFDGASVGASVRESPARRLPDQRAPMRVLVVDDNADAAELMADVLRIGDRVVEVAHDGPEALNAVERFAPDAVVLDIGLPIMDGYELARLLREWESGRPGGRRLRLIAVTGYGQETDRERSARAGMDVHLVKPVELADIEAALADQPTPVILGPMSPRQS